MDMRRLGRANKLCTTMLRTWGSSLVLLHLTYLSLAQSSLRSWGFSLGEG